MLILVYRPPSSSHSDDSKLIDSLQILCSLHRDIVLAGDFNLLIDWSARTPLCSASARFIKLFDDLSLTQHVLCPTRNDNILDLVLSTSPLVHNVTIRPPLGLSDHASIYFDLMLPIDFPRMDCCPDYASGDYVAISACLDTIDWWSLLDNSCSIDDMYQRFLDLLHDLLSRFIPLKRARYETDHYPTHIKNLIEQRDRLFCTIHDPLTSDRYKNVVKKLNRHLAKFSANRQKRLSNMNTSSLFKYAHLIFKEKHGPQGLHDHQGNLCKTDQENAECLAHYFASVFQKPTNSRPSLPNDLTNQIQSSLYLSQVPQVLPFDVMNILKRLKPSTFITADGIPQMVYKRCATQLAVPVSILVNMSLSSGELPRVWKHGRVVPIPKVQNPQKASEFRPISINSVVCKVAEKIVRRKLLSFCVQKHLIPSEQFGFMEGSSTTLQLITCDFYWKRALAQNRLTDVLYFDLSKAFDRVDIHKLIEKLYSVGIRGGMLKWLTSYLTERTLSVRVNSAISSIFSATSGVPQGGVLSPILFNIYTSELPGLLSIDWRIKVMAYADDIKVFASYSDEDKVESVDLLSLTLAISSLYFPMPHGLHLGKAFHGCLYNSVDTTLLNFGPRSLCLN
ncbi:unnamed protein product [Cylicocyclus nassatus]|uniref:Reverse transcriptase domain-containing protein n=1 Tax=Cylicocyclus nassatus TaxID=53992 RepID=A0AA36DQA0_CYLNA|nr:unnamed protein product [Cylicocyclus nassatus]